MNQLAQDLEQAVCSVLERSSREDVFHGLELTGQRFARVFALVERKELSEVEGGVLLRHILEETGLSASQVRDHFESVLR